MINMQLLMLTLSLFLGVILESLRGFKLFNLDEVVAAVGAKIWLETVVLQPNGLAVANGGYCAKVSANKREC